MFQVLNFDLIEWLRKKDVSIDFLQNLPYNVIIYISFFIKLVTFNDLRNIIVR